MEVEQVALDGKRARPKRRTHTNIRHSIETLAINSHTRDVHAVCRNQFVIAREVECRNCISRAVSSAPPRIRQNAERAPQQCAGPLYAPSSNQAANLAARHVIPAQRLLRVRVYVEPHLAPELRQRLDIPLRLMTKMKVVALMYFLRMQCIDQHISCKVVRRH